MCHLEDIDIISLNCKTQNSTTFEGETADYYVNCCVMEIQYADDILFNFYLEKLQDFPRTLRPRSEVNIRPHYQTTMQIIFLRKLSN